MVSNRNPVKAASNKVARVASRNQASRISNPDRAGNRVAARGSPVSKTRDKAARTASTNKAPAVAGVFHARPSIGVTESRGKAQTQISPRLIREACADDRSHYRRSVLF